jgi:hypothetical protein
MDAKRQSIELERQELTRSSAERESAANAEISKLRSQLEQLQTAFDSQAQAEVATREKITTTEVATLRSELDRLQAASVEELQRKQTEISAITDEVVLLRQKNEWLQKSSNEVQEVAQLRAQVGELQASLDLAAQATAQVDADLAAEKAKSATLQEQVALKTNGERQRHVGATEAPPPPPPPAPPAKDGINSQAHEASLARIRDLEEQLRFAEQDRDAAVSRATSAERVLEEQQETRSRGLSSNGLENVPLLEAEDASDSPDAMRARIRQLESQLKRAEASSSSLQLAASRAAEKLQSQAMKERELEQQLAATNGGAQFFSALVTGVGAVPNIMVSATGKCLRGRQGVDSQARPPPPPPPTPPVASV